jgi:hypothetical protein
MHWMNNELDMSPSSLSRPHCLETISCHQQPDTDCVLSWICQTSDEAREERITIRWLNGTHQKHWNWMAILAYNQEASRRLEWTNESIQTLYTNQFHLRQHSRNLPPTVRSVPRRVGRSKNKEKPQPLHLHLIAILAPWCKCNTKVSCQVNSKYCECVSQLLLLCVSVANHLHILGETASHINHLSKEPLSLYHVGGWHKQYSLHPVPRQTCTLLFESLHFWGHNFKPHSKLLLLMLNCNFNLKLFVKHPVN